MYLQETALEKKLRNNKKKEKKRWERENGDKSSSQGRAKQETRRCTQKLPQGKGSPMKTMKGKPLAKGKMWRTKIPRGLTCLARVGKNVTQKERKRLVGGSTGPREKKTKKHRRVDCWKKCSKRKPDQGVIG